MSACLLLVACKLFSCHCCLAPSRLQFPVVCCFFAALYIYLPVPPIGYGPIALVLCCFSFGFRIECPSQLIVCSGFLSFPRPLCCVCFTSSPRLEYQIKGLCGIFYIPVKFCVLDSHLFLLACVISVCWSGCVSKHCFRNFHFVVSNLGLHLVFLIPPSTLNFCLLSS